MVYVAWIVGGLIGFFRQTKSPKRDFEETVASINLL